MKLFSITCLLLAAVLSTGGVLASTQNDTVAGKWHFVLETDGGPREAPAEFQVSDGKVTGKWGNAEVAGTYLDGKLDLAFRLVSEEAGEGILKLKGSLAEGKLKGQWEFQQYAGTFTADRRQ